jgi:CRISPR-associated endonuclease Csy4
MPKYKNNEALVGRCLKILHGVCVKYKINTIAVSFPNWSSESIGDKISFISPNPLELDFLLQQTYFSEMVSLNYFKLSKLAIVPEQCELAYFKRNQKIDQSTPNGQKIKAERLAKRALERGDILDKFTPKSQTFSHYHSVPITSTRSQNSFRLNLQCHSSKEKVQGNWAFSSYGLSNQKMKSMPVPII